MVNMSNLRMPQIGQVYNPGSYFMPTIPQPQRFYTPAQMAQIRPSPRWATPQVRPGAQGPTAGFAAMQPPFRQSVRGAGPNVANAPGMRMTGRGLPGPPQAGRAISNGPQLASAAAGGQPRGPTAPGAPPTYKYPAPAMRTPSQAMQPQQSVSQAPPSAVHIQGQEPLSASALAAAHPNDQKQMLGERLFPLIHEKYPTVAGKVTGMLLEMDNAEILHLLEDRDLLSSRVEEAVAVLQMHQTKQPTAQPN